MLPDCVEVFLVLSYPPNLWTSLILFCFLIYLPPTHTHTHTPTQAHICWKVEVRYIHSALGHSSHTTYVMSASSPGSTGPEVSLSKEEEVDLALQKNESGVESALLYAKTLSKYIKDLLGCMEKRLAMGETCIILLLMNINNRCNRKTKLWFLVLKCLSGRNFLALLIFCQIWRNIINVCCLVHLSQPFIVSSSCVDLFCQILSMPKAMPKWQSLQRRSPVSR